MSRWVDGLEASAKPLVPEPVHTYVSQGAGDGVTMSEAIGAWRDLRLRPAILRDVSALRLATTLVGTPLSLPVAVGPTTLQRQLHPDGEVEMARGVAAADTLVCVSSNAGNSFASVADQGAPWWVQAYVLRDRGVTRDMLQRAVDAGATAVVLTADTPVVASKLEGDISVWDLVPAEHLHANEELRGVPHRQLEKASNLTPDVIGWLAATTGLPAVVKGVLRADDAITVVEAGAAGVWVSNHGGRQLDRAVSTARALPEIATAVGTSAEVMVDGGIRSGLDVLTALALGARAAFVARPAMWALATGGAAHVTRLLETVRSELEEAMRLAGIVDVAGVRNDLVDGVPQTEGRGSRDGEATGRRRVLGVDPGA